MDEQEKKQLEEKLALAEKERDEYLNGWKRAKADLINAKKEWADQMKDLSGFVKTEFIKEFLPVLDALALTSEIAGWQEIKKLVSDLLNRHGVQEIEALGKKFDPQHYEAVSEGEGNPDEIIAVLQKGYIINGRVIRPAKVKIGKNK